MPLTFQSDGQKKIAEMLAAQALDSSPIQSPWQGLDRMSKALLAGWGMQNADAQTREADAWRAKMVLGDTSAVPSPMPAAQPTAAQTMTAALGGQRPVQIVEGDGPSPLDPPTGQDRDLMIRTIAGEDPGQSALGVANVIRRRAIDGNFGGNTPSQVVTAPGQFEPWARPDARARMMALQPESPEYQRLGGVVDQAYAGNDPTGGATHFFAPKAQAALGRQPPNWAQGPGTTIGLHQFHGGVGQPQPQQMAQARPDPLASAPPNVRAAIIQGIQSTNPEIKRAAFAAAQQYLKPVEAKHGVIGKDQFGNEVYGWSDPRARSLNPTTVAQQQAQPGQSGAPAIPPPPPGVDPRQWYKERGERVVKESMPASFEDTAKVRGEIRSLPSYKNISEAAPIYKTMLETAGRDTRASDLNLVYGLGKIFDPGSVVREGEMVMVKNTAGLPDWLVGAINSLNGGAGLTPATRQAIMAEAHSRMQSYASLFEQESSMYRGIAERNRMRPDDVIPRFGPFEPWQRPANKAPDPAQQQPSTTQEGATATNPTTGQRIIFRGGRWVPAQ